MDNKNRPRAREKNVTGAGKGVQRKGSGLGTGPVSSGGSNPFGRGQSSSSGRSSGTRGTRGGISPLIIVLLLVLLFGGGGGLSSLLGGSGSTGSDSAYYSSSQTQSGSSSQSSGSQGGYASLLPGTSSGQTSSFNGWSSGSTGWTGSSNTGTLNRSVDPAAREKFTTIRGGGKDQVTVMVYLCGTDLESRSRMATRDLMEMTSATLSDSVNLIVYTGGCSSWQNNVVSSNYNQIYRVHDGGLDRLVSNAGTGSMTDPATLVSFLDYCRTNFPANRYDLILWDHGGGSLSGYGYDQKHSSSGSMSLASLESALKKAGMTYDFVGFDACLMATVETASMLSRYADYLIASEETEPGIGWYYTNWLTKLSADPSMPTLDIGKQIVDDFVDACGQQCPGQSTTLSVVDLSELGETLPDDLSAFSQSLKTLITDGDYKTVSSARGDSREFAASTVIDQIDFVDFAQRLGTDEGKDLSKVLLSAVKYNRTSSRMTNAYGLSVYFPMRKLSNVSKAVKTYDALGMDEDFTDCIREFASMETSGQVVSGASGYAVNPYSALFGGDSSSLSAPQGAGDIADLLSLFLGGGTSSGLDSSYFSDRSLSNLETTAQYLADNRFDASALYWQRSADGSVSLALPEEQWALVQDLDLNLFYDDGSGYVDMGLDNLFSFDENGNLVPDTDGTWLSLNDQPVVYTHTDTTEDGDHYSIRGTVPARLWRDDATGWERVDLVLIFNDEHPHGFVAGAQPVYLEGETETVARGLIELEDGMTIQCLCDFYSYDGDYEDSYPLGDPIEINGELRISDTYLGGSGQSLIFYRFTDLYGQHYWSEPLTIG